MSTREIQGLRKKFILISMGAIFLAMTFIGLMVNITTYEISHVSINNMLTGLIESAEEQDAREYEYGFSFSDVFSPAYGRNIYYVLNYDTNNLLLTFHSNVSDRTEADIIRKYADVLLHRGNRNGQYNGYYYKIMDLEYAVTSIAFMEGSMIIETQSRVLLLTVMFGIFGMVITFFLVWRFSGRAVRQVIENSIRQKQFITNASHELKTPLAIIRGNADMMEMTQGENEWTRSILRQVDHLNGLIQNLVMITRSQEKEDRNNLSEVDAAKIVCESIDPYEPLAAQTGLLIQRTITSDVRIKIDESKLRQLVSILFDNAIKYCDENGTIGVELIPVKGRKKIRLTVSNDYKDGITVDCSRFFDRFYREDPSHNIDKGGYGIGLSIAESICRQYGGSISADWKDNVISFVCFL